MTGTHLTWPLAALVAAFALPTTTLGQDAQQAQEQQAQEQQAQEQQAQEQQAQEQQAQEQQAQEQQQAKQLKIFQLEHRSPQEISRLLRRGGLGIVRTHPRAENVENFATPDYPSPSEVESELLIATDEERNLLLVRATPDELEQVEQLVEAFDAPADAMQEQTFRGMRLIPIGNQDATRVNNVLNDLQLPSDVVNLGETTVILLRTEKREGQDGDDELKQAQEVITRLTEEKEQAQEEQAQEEQAQEENG